MTRQIANVTDNRELQIKVTLRELLIYLVFLTDVCIGELCYVTSTYCSQLLDLEACTNILCSSVFSLSYGFVCAFSCFALSVQKEVC